MLTDNLRPVAIGMDFIQQEDPNRRFIGGLVSVRTKGYKHYRGIIRDTLNDGYALVELEATLRRTRIKLQDLAL